jgi:hypothetical protein
MGDEALGLSVRKGVKMLGQHCLVLLTLEPISSGWVSGMPSLASTPARRLAQEMTVNGAQTVSTPARRLAQLLHTQKNT